MTGNATFLPPQVLAHERWFEEGSYASEWSFAFEPLTLALLGFAVAATLVVRVLDRIHPGVVVPFLARAAPYMPFVVRLHLAVSLVGLLSLGYYLSPAMDLETNFAGFALGAVMAVSAVGMATGWHARAAAALLVAAGPLGMLEFGFWSVLQRVDVLGLALFVIVAGPGRWSADYELGRAGEVSVRRVAQALWSLRMAAGLALIVVAFAEKLAFPDLALTFLADRPELNVFRAIGLPVSDIGFIRIAGAIEVMFGLMLMSGALPQFTVVAIGVPFNATLWFFGINELVGHLPLYGGMLALLVYGSHPRLREVTHLLWPFGRRAPGEPAEAAQPERPAPRRAGVGAATPSALDG